MNKVAYSIVMNPNSANISETRDPVYIALEDLETELEWTSYEVREMEEFLKDGANVKHLKSIADHFDRTCDETMLLMIDRMYIDPISGVGAVEEIYLALESINVNYFWHMSEIYKFERLYNRGENILNIAKILNRNEVDVVVLTIDRAMRGSLEVVAS